PIPDARFPTAVMNTGAGTKLGARPVQVRANTAHRQRAAWLIPLLRTVAVRVGNSHAGTGKDRKRLQAVRPAMCEVCSFRRILPDAGAVLWPGGTITEPATYLPAGGGGPSAAGERRVCRAAGGRRRDRTRNSRTSPADCRRCRRSGLARL